MHMVAHDSNRNHFGAVASSGSRQEAAQEFGARRVDDRVPLESGPGKKGVKCDRHGGTPRLDPRSVTWNVVKRSVATMSETMLPWWGASPALTRAGSAKNSVLKDALLSLSSERGLVSPQLMHPASGVTEELSSTHATGPLPILKRTNECWSDILIRAQSAPAGRFPNAPQTPLGVREAPLGRRVESARMDPAVA